MQWLISELQRRKVLRVASAYLVAGWLVLQVAGTLENAMSLPAWFDTLILALLAVGFPIALVASWLFEFTPAGIRRTTATGDGTLLKPGLADWALAGLLAAVLIFATTQAIIPRDGAQPVAETVNTKRAMPATLGPKSVAVLPFANLSAEGENAYIADGLTEELRSILARIPDLKVVSRTSSFAFKGKGTPIPQIVQQLGVRHIVEGSVRQDGETVRVTAQLIDVESDTTLWSEAYERTAGDAFAIQDTIAREVANALDVELNVLAESKHGPTRDAEAYRLFLKARELFRLRRTRDNADSIALYLQAIERDPKFAEARAGLGLSYFVAGRLEESRESAEAALQQKPVALAHAVLGNLERVKLRWQTASEHMSKAVELDPSDSAAQFNLGRLQVQMGHLEEGSRRMDDALRIDPLFHYIQADIAAAAFARGDDQRATAVANKLVKSTAEYGSLGYFFLAHDARVKGDLTAAEAHLRRFMAPRWKNKDVIDLAIAALSRKVPAEQVAEALAKNSDGIAASSRSAVSTAIVLLAIGAEGAFLDRLGSIVATDRSSASTVVIYAWRLASEGKGNDPRFKEFLRKLGLPAHWKANGWPDKCRADGGDAFACS